MAETERETFDQRIIVRVSTTLHDRILSLIGPRSSVSEYVRRLLEAAVDAPNEQFVIHREEAEYDNV